MRDSVLDYAFTALATWLAASLTDAFVAAITVDPTIRAATIGAVLGAGGGVCAALMPWGERSWSWQSALRVLVIGTVVGAFTYIGFLDVPDRWSGGPNMEKVWAGIVGFLGTEALRKLRQAGVRGISEWIVRMLTRNASPSPTSPPRGSNDTT